MKLNFLKPFFSKLVKDRTGSDYNQLPVMANVNVKVKVPVLRPGQSAPANTRTPVVRPSVDPGVTPRQAEPGDEGKSDSAACGAGGGGDGGTTGSGGGDGNDP